MAGGESDSLPLWVWSIAAFKVYLCGVSDYYQELFSYQQEHKVYAVE